MSSCPAQAIEGSFTIPGEIESLMSNCTAQALQVSYTIPRERGEERRREMIQLNSHFKVELLRTRLSSF